MNRIKIAVIDDNEKILSIIREVIDFESDLEICDEAKDIEQARKVIKKCQPDVVILDISIGEREAGLDFLKEIETINKPSKTIILSAHDEQSYADKSIRAGAKGYVCKDKTVRCLADAIRSVHAGNEFISSN